MCLKMMKKIRKIFKYKHFWKLILLFDRTFYRRYHDTKYVHIVSKYSDIFANKKVKKGLLLKNKKFYAGTKARSSNPQVKEPMLYLLS